MVKNVSKRKTDNTLTLKTFSDLKLSLSAKHNFLVKKIHNINIVFFYCWIYIVKKLLLQKECLLIDLCRNDPCNIYGIILGTFGDLLNFLDLGIPKSQNHKVSQIWLVLTNLIVLSIFPTHFLPRNLVLNSEFKNSIISGSFPKFSGFREIFGK